MNNIDIQQATPPARIGGRLAYSKYDEAINTAINNKNTWFKVTTTPLANRQSLYSTASAIRQGRLGNVPDGEKIEVMCRRVDNEIVMFIQGL